MKKVFGYIRVSTVKQGTGVSLQEQKEAIVRYADKQQLEIIEWFEEQETAAKQGRPLFTKMMKLIRSGKSRGVIIHKIDRGARNLKDWGLLGDLIDEGFEIHFAHESLDMNARGGRLAADIQAVIASDYIRNLREETLKGINGRLKQGLYPFRAPMGYNDNGGGKLKTIDKVVGPLIKQAFLLYASNKYSLHTLTQKMIQLGLKNPIGHNISITTLSKILNNPFYAGIIKVKDKTYTGNHESLISPALFTQVQNVLTGKTNSRTIKHEFLFRRSIKCEECSYSLIGELQKGNIYYRCHSKNCSTKSIREEIVEKEIKNTINQIQLLPEEYSILDELLLNAQNNWSEVHTGIEESLNMQHSKISQKLDKLTDAYIESVIDQIQFEEKKEKILLESKAININRGNILGEKELIFKKAKNYIELAKSLTKTYSIGIHEEKKKLLNIITSKLSINQKKLMITIRSPFYEMAKRYNFIDGDPTRYTPRINIAKMANVNNKLSKSHNPRIKSSKENLELLKANMQSLLDLILKLVEDLPDINQELNNDVLS
ncbi:MAG: recombinase family protein [Saprospiraceae bacterium]|nr:recombinase family protein [Candidatus Defluviibacterium haderslevense]